MRAQALYLFFGSSEPYVVAITIRETGSWRATSYRLPPGVFPAVLLARQRGCGRNKQTMNIQIEARLQRKLAILADAAKYDASCASSGASGRNSRDGKGLGSTTGSGICHAYTPDGRCVSLLKVLLTNFCVYDCAFCVNRLSSNTPRARFKVEEIVALTLGFYRRNMIEELFLSSGIAKSEDHTMEGMVRVA
jgi:hypothetical protein